MKQRSLLTTIMQLGGINTRYLRDLTGENRTGRAGLPVGLFRKPGIGKRSGLKETGLGLDELCPMLRAEGFSIYDCPVDGGVQHLREMIRDEIDGHSKVYASGAQEEQWELEREAEFAAYSEQQRMSRLLQLAQDLRQIRRAERMAK